MCEDTNIKGADTESDFWLIIYSVMVQPAGVCNLGRLRTLLASPNLIRWQLSALRKGERMRSHLGHLFSIGFRVVWRVGEEDGTVFRRHTKFIEGVLPQLKITNKTILMWWPDGLIYLHGGFIIEIFFFEDSFSSEFILERMCLNIRV